MTDPWSPDGRPAAAGSPRPRRSAGRSARGGAADKQIKDRAEQMGEQDHQHPDEPSGTVEGGVLDRVDQRPDPDDRPGNAERDDEEEHRPADAAGPGSAVVLGKHQELV